MYIHILKEKRTKLDPSGKKGIFVGYTESSKAYRIYFPGFKKIDISRNLKFDEDSAYNKSIKRPAEDPEEFLSSKNLELSHLRIFGCPIYTHIPKEKRTKLDPFGKKCIFIGYSEISKDCII